MRKSASLAPPKLRPLFMFYVFFWIDIVFIVSGAIPEPILSEPTFVISEGRTLKIECRTKGTFAKLSWEKEGVKVSDEKVTDRPFYYVGGLVVAESILTIEDVTLQDSGIYKCVSVSRFDSAKKASADAQVNVKGIIYIHKFLFLAWKIQKYTLISCGIVVLRTSIYSKKSLLNVARQLVERATVL